MEFLLVGIIIFGLTIFWFYAFPESAFNCKRKLVGTAYTTQLKEIEVNRFEDVKNEWCVFVTKISGNLELLSAHRVFGKNMYVLDDTLSSANAKKYPVEVIIPSEPFAITVGPVRVTPQDWKNQIIKYLEEKGYSF